MSLPTAKFHLSFRFDFSQAYWHRDGVLTASYYLSILAERLFFSFRCFTSLPPHSWETGPQVSVQSHTIGRKGKKNTPTYIHKYCQSLHWEPVEPDRKVVLLSPITNPQITEKLQLRLETQKPYLPSDLWVLEKFDMNRDCELGRGHWMFSSAPVTSNQVLPTKYVSDNFCPYPEKFICS